MNRFVACLLLTAFLQLQGATCCHCAQGLLGDSRSDLAAACDPVDHIWHSHDADHQCPRHDSNDDDACPIAPPCGPDHGGHMCVISHVRFINSNTFFEFDVVTLGLHVDVPPLDLHGFAGTFIGNFTNVSDSITTLLDCHTLLRI